MNKPLISVVLCTYNGERFIQQQLDSILKQTHSPLEIIIADDASTDGTRSILEKYRQYPHVRLFLNDRNLGAIKNFEFALQKATGKYISFSDQDDIWLPEKLEKLLNAIEEHFLVYSDSELIDENDNSLHKRLSDLRKMYSGNQTKGFVFSNTVWGHAMMINELLRNQVLPVPAYIPHDIWIAFRAASLSGIQYVHQPLTLYRQHQQTVTKTIAEKTSTRLNEKRFSDFEKKLYWIGLMRDHARADEKPFYEKLFELYNRKRKGSYVWPLLNFMMRQREKLFMFSRKNWLSQLVEIAKQARGEK